MKLMSTSNSQLESIYSCEEMVHVVGAVVVGQWAPTSNEEKFNIHLISIGLTGW